MSRTTLPYKREVPTATAVGTSLLEAVFQKKAYIKRAESFFMKRKIKFRSHCLEMISPWNRGL
jgi:hypothetical protein